MNASQQLTHQLQPCILVSHHAFTGSLNLGGQPSVHWDEQNHDCQASQKGIPDLHSQSSTP